jgi:hypothetical protein
MSVELIAISSFCVALLSGLAHFVKRSNLKECTICCINSNCRDEDKASDLKMKELNERIEKNEKKIIKNKTKLEEIKKKRMSNLPATPDSALSEISHFEKETEI